MERAEFAAGSIEVRGSGAIHRLLSFLGAFFLGIGPDARPARDHGNWWDREAPAPRDDSPVRLTLGRQAELFDEAGQAAFQALAPEAPLAPPAPAPVPAAAPRTIVSVRSKSRTTARVVATTRVAPAVRVAAIAKTPAAARGTVARHLVMSQSISSGREEARWFSVPQRVLLPRFQLFAGAESVTEDAGGLRIEPAARRAQGGQVWFV